MADAMEPGAPRLTQNQIWERRGLAVLLIFAVMLGGVVWWRGHPPGQKRAPASRHASLGPPGPPQLVVQMGHSAAITALAFSPDGTLLASAAEDGTLKLWDTARWALRQTERAHLGHIGALAFAPDGQTLASAGADKAVRLRDAWTGRTLRAVAHAKPVLGVGFSPDSRFGVSAAAGAVRLWEVQNGGSSQTLIEDAAPVQCFAWADTAALVATGGMGFIHLWDARTSKLRRSLPAPGGETCALVFAPDGQSLAAAGTNGVVQLLETRQGTPRHTFTVPGRTFPALAFAPDGKTLAAALDTGNVVLWDAGNGTLQHTLAGQGGSATAVAFSPDGKTLVSGDAQGGLLVWDVARGAVQRALMAPLRQTIWNMSSDKKWLTSGWTDGRLRRWNLQTGQLQRSWVAHPSGVWGLLATANGKTLISFGHERRIKLWDPVTGQLRRTVEGYGGPPTEMALTRNGRTLVSLHDGQRCGDDGCLNTVEVYVWDIARAKPRRTLWVPAPDDWFCLAWTGACFVDSHDGGVVEIWDTHSGQLRWKAPAPDADGAISDAFFADDGKTFVTLHDTGTVNLWQLTARPSPRALAHSAPAHPARAHPATSGKANGARRLRTLLRGERAIKSLSISGDMKTLVSWDTRSGTVWESGAELSLEPPDVSPSIRERLWDMRTGRLKKTFEGHAGDAFPDGLALKGWPVLTENPDGTLRLSGSRTGRLLATLAVLPTSRGPRPATEWIVFTPQGYYDASPGAAPLIHWCVGDDLWPGAKFEKQFHRPDLVQKALRGQ